MSRSRSRTAPLASIAPRPLAPRPLARLALARLALALLTLAPPALRDARACAPAPRPGAFVAVAHEEALIAWDSASSTEHFVRRATFQGQTDDFGFLVPTPTRPELAEADPALFETLEHITRPRVSYERRLRGVELTAISCCTLRAASKSAALAPVTVLEARLVGGYDAVVLEARSPEALAAWLASRGYDNRPSLRAWLAPYVQAGWKLTAFKIASGQRGPVRTSPVRMSFRTERPFFPYREPDDQRDPAHASGERLLRVYLASDARFDGSLGDGSAPWPGQVVHAKPLDPAWVSPQLASLGHPSFLTVFEDRASPRPGTEEVFFARSPSQQNVERPPQVIVVDKPFPLPIELIVLGALGLFVWRFRRKATGPEGRKFHD